MQHATPVELWLLTIFTAFAHLNFIMFLAVDRKETSRESVTIYAGVLLFVVVGLIRDLFCSCHRRY